MAGWDDVGRVARALPETELTAPRRWAVHGKGFVWERPLRARDFDELAERGRTPPDDPPIAFYVDDEGDKLALTAGRPDVFFTTAHFTGYAIVLAHLDALPVQELAEIVEDAWLARAPKRVAAAFLRVSTDRPT